MNTPAHSTSPSPLPLPDGFVLGTSTSAYQVEGAVDEDGRGQSIWDVFSHTPGKTAEGATGDVAADHYHRLEEDLDLIAALGVGAYRFSVSWPRVMPDGEGRVNPAGLDFYSRLVDGLLARGVDPVLTLNHWDLPQVLEERYGGWRGRETAEAFARYADVVAGALGDRVTMWTTHNEPWNNSYTGYGNGDFAPGGTDPVDALRAVHHLNLSHGMAVRALRSTLPAEAKVGVVLNVLSVEPLDPTSAEDAAAAQAFDAAANGAFTGPMLEGAYPDELMRITEGLTDWDFVLPGDLEACHQELDFLGVNYYEGTHVRALDHATGPANRDFPGSERLETVRLDGLPRTAMGWSVEPWCLEEHLVDLSRRYPGLPLIIMENGAAFEDEVTRVDGRAAVLDHDRVDYLDTHLRAVLRARERGADVRGYYVWSLLDNFEWASGYGPRFGIVRVDYDTLERLPKLSAHWLARTCRTRAIAPAGATGWDEGLLALTDTTDHP